LTASRRNDLEIIVLDWDGGEMLTNCLHSIKGQSQQPGRVIIFDNGSRLPVYQRLAKGLLSIPYELVRSETNIGFTGGMNRAMELVRAPFVAWVNNDVVLSEKWIEKLLPAVSGEGKVAGAQSVILRDKKTVDGAGISIDQGVFRQIGHGQTLASVRQLPTPWGISATAAVFRTHALREVAVQGAILPPDFFAYYEDVDLCARLREKGWKFKLVAEPLAMHRGSASAARLGSEGFRLRVRNRYLVARRNRGVGSVSALLAEDLSYAMKEAARGNFRDAATRLGAMARGVSG
jgi:GT2 family glycosyltransferase